MNDAQWPWSGQIFVKMGEHPFDHPDLLETLLEAKYEPPETFELIRCSMDFRSASVASTVSYFEGIIEVHPFLKYFSMPEECSMIQFSNIAQAHEVTYIRRVLGRLEQANVSHYVEVSGDNSPRTHLITGYNAISKKRFDSVQLGKYPDLKQLCKSH